MINTKEEALKWIPEKLHTFMLSNRPLDIMNVHVTQLTAPPQLVALHSLFPETDIQKTGRLSLGIAFHDYCQDNEHKFQREIFFGGNHLFNLVGEPDYVYEWTDSTGALHDDCITDIKVTSAYKVKKAIEQSVQLEESGTTIENFPYDVEEFKEMFPDVFDWVYQSSCYNFLMEQRYTNVFANILAVNFDAGNKRIMEPLRKKFEFELLDVHPIHLPLIPINVLLPDIVYRYKLLYKMNEIVTKRNVLTDPRDEEIAEKLDDLGVRCKPEDVWGGRRCSDYCNLKDICFGIDGTPKAKLEEK